MHYQFSSYIFPHLISLVILIGLGVFGYKHRNFKAARGFIASVVIIALWILSFLMGIAAVNFEVKLFWSNLQYIAFAFSPVCWLILVLQFAGGDKWINKKNIILISIVPVLTSVLAWTKLIRIEISMDNLGIFPITTEFGPWFTVHYVYSHLLTIVSIVILVSIIWRKNYTFSKQAVILLVGISIIVIIDYLSVFNIISIERTLIDSVGFTLFSVIVGIGIFYFQLFDLVPVARETVIEEMDSGIIVIDRMKRIVDINPAAREMFGLEEKINAGEILSNLSVELDECINPDGDLLSKERFEIDRDGRVYYFELKISPIRDYQGGISSWIIIIDDISYIKKANDRIKNQIEELAVMNERERMARELHDNLGQILSFSDIQIQSALKKLRKNKYQVVEEYLERLKGIIKDANKEIREYVYNIRDNLDYNKDFRVLLRDEINELKKKALLDIKLITSEEINLLGLDIEEKVHLLYIVREAVTNVLKHADADEVFVTIAVEDDNLVLCVEDDGKGIDSLEGKKGAGLSIMNERARLISGELILKSEAGEGTSIIVVLPGRNRRFNYENNDS